MKIIIIQCGMHLERQETFEEVAKMGCIFSPRKSPYCYIITVCLQTIADMCSLSQNKVLFVVKTVTIAHTKVVH